MGVRWSSSPSPAAVSADVRYILSVDPLTLYVCHWTDCQRQSGASFVMSMAVRSEGLQLVQGSPQEYSIELPDGRRKQAKFCGRCTTRLWGPSRVPGLAVLRPGTLDDTSWLDPVGHIWTSSAQSGVHIPDGTLNFKGQPEGDKVLALVRAWKERSSPYPATLRMRS